MWASGPKIDLSGISSSHFGSAAVVIAIVGGCLLLPTRLAPYATNLCNEMGGAMVLPRRELATEALTRNLIVIARSVKKLLIRRS